MIEFLTVCAVLLAKGLIALAAVTIFGVAALMAGAFLYGAALAVWKGTKRGVDEG